MPALKDRRTVPRPPLSSDEFSLSERLDPRATTTVSPVESAEGVPRPERAPARPELSRALLVAVPLAYAAVAATELYRAGAPAIRERLLLWLLGGLLCLSLTNLGRFFRGLLFEWLPFLAVLTAYDFLRGLSDELLPVHTRPQLLIDEIVFGWGTAPTVRLQDALWDGAGHLHWYDYASWGVYMSYFFATPLIAAALWLFAPRRFRLFIGSVAVLSFTAFATYLVYPASPPWRASDFGYLEPTTRSIGIVGGELPWIDWQPLVERGHQWSNQVAAVPSLHEGMTVLIALFLWRTAHPLLRVVLVAYPLAMGFALVYSAEHYVADLVLGALYAVLVYWAMRRLAGRLERRRQASAVV
jgi:hypothetical protein